MGNNIAYYIKNPIVTRSFNVGYTAQYINELLAANVGEIVWDEFRINNSIDDEIKDDYIKAWLKIGLIETSDMHYNKTDNLKILQDLAEKFPEIIYLHFFISCYQSKNDKLKSLRKGMELGCPTATWELHLYLKNCLSDELWEGEYNDCLKKAVELNNYYAINTILNMSYIDISD